MSQLIECDYCGKLYNQSYPTEPEKYDYLTKWIHNSDYDFDACSNECNSRLCEKYYSEE